MNEPFIHYPTMLDWIEHVAVFVGFFALGWWTHRHRIRKLARDIDEITIKLKGELDEFDDYVNEYKEAQEGYE